MWKIIVDVHAVWKDTRLIVLTAQIASIYAAILIPFKVGIPLIPGFAELRPANAIPVVTSLLFGPPAAWGSAIGNLIGDCFGTLGPASAFGFLGNFLYGSVPYLMWGRLGPFSSGREPLIHSWRQGLEFGIICIMASMVCAGVVAWGVEFLGLLPFSILAPAIFLNNVVMGLLLGPPLLLFLYPRVKRWNLRFEDIRQTFPHHDHSMKRWTPAPQTENLSAPHDNLSSMVEINHLNFQYAHTSRFALHDVSLRINRGELVALIGRSGSGKSTLCYTLNGLIPQFLPGIMTGSVYVNGMDTTHEPVWKQAETTGVVFQDFETQLISTNVEMELAYPLDQGNTLLSEEDRHTCIEQALELVSLTGLNRRDPLTLSGGQRQRLVIASMLVRNPSLLVLDQPMTDLDPAGRQEIMTLLYQLKQQGSTVILAEQDPEDLLHVDRIIVLDQGQVKWEGPPHTLWAQPALMKCYGLRPLPLAECFSGTTHSTLPATVEEAWKFVDAHHMKVETHPTHLQMTQRTPPIQPEQERNILRLENVGFAYTEEAPALQDVSITIQEGEYIAIIGRNGSGKSTFAKLLNGLLLPIKGQVLVEEMDTKTMPISQLARVVGYVFQNPDHQIFAESIWDEVAFGIRHVGYHPEAYTEQVIQALEAVGFDAQQERTVDPFSLTKGARQRVAVASVLAAKPKVLIIDEPNTGLDAEETTRLMEVIHHLHQAGHTIVLITHTMRIVAEYATRCLVMHKGQVLADGPTRSIFSDRSLIEAAGLDVPSVTQFSQRWGRTLLTVKEVQAALIARSYDE
ncbi:MAG: ATP-binding cassette domain-containing protein [Nitrospirales bacterium]|nr:ATP-binding cassette domain-containing protein [Nitrospirales bacterium]